MEMSQESDFVGKDQVILSINPPVSTEVKFWPG